MDPDPNSIGLQVLLIVVLTLVNAYFAASEMAIVSVSKTKIHHLSEQGNKKAKLVEELLEQPTNFLSTIQVAITLAGFFNSASAATGISVIFCRFFKSIINTLCRYNSNGIDYSFDFFYYIDFW